MQIRRCGEQAVVLSVSYDKTADAVREIQGICQYIRKHPNPAVVSVRPGLDCVLIEYSSNIEPWLQKLSAASFDKKEPARRRRYKVPVCYEMGEDLAAVASATGLRTDEIVQIHSSRIYQVWMIGFMPGFPYMGELPERLQLPRKKTPVVSVPAGSVAIAEEYVGIYPFQSPGGWHIIGRTPLQILDYKKETPCLFDYSMEVQFTPISKDEFERMKDEAARN